MWPMSFKDMQQKFWTSLYSFRMQPVSRISFLNTQCTFWTEGGALFHGTFFPLLFTALIFKKILQCFCTLLKKWKKKFLHPSYYSVCASQTRLPQSSSVILHWNRLYWLLWSIVPFSSPPSSSSSWCYIMSGCYEQPDRPRRDYH